MINQTFRLTTAACAGLAILIGSFSSAIAQFGTFQPAGVEVDAQGMLRTRIFQDPNGSLTKMRIQAAQQQLESEVQEISQLRMISLQRLEQSIRERLENNQPLTEEQMYMAGLTSISHVFFYPTSRDIVIAGPAEGFYTDLAGRVVGIESGKPVLHLEDFIVALRAFPPSGESTGVIGVSIDPTAEGNARLQAAVRSFGGQLGNHDPREIARIFYDAIGNQQISIKGVSPKTRFAQVLVEADYRMKKIGIGLEKPAVNFKTFIDSVSPSSAASGQLQRWYFVPDYDTIKVSEDELAMELVGQGAKLMDASEMVQRDGTRVTSTTGNSASKGFTTNFTKKFPKLAERTPVFAELKNMIDMAIVAAFIQEVGYYEKADWNMELFADESQLPTQRYREPKQVEPAINIVKKKSAVMFPTAGGVNIQARQALSTEHMIYDESGETEQARNTVNLDQIDPGRWWWN